MNSILMLVVLKEFICIKIYNKKVNSTIIFAAIIQDTRDSYQTINSNSGLNLLFKDFICFKDFTSFIKYHLYLYFENPSTTSTSRNTIHPQFQIVM